jgi:hypothetical protein
VPQFRIYDLRSTYATRLSAGGADEWVTQLLRHGDAKVQEVLADEIADEREALQKVNRVANETGVLDRRADRSEFWGSRATVFVRKAKVARSVLLENALESKGFRVGA